MSGLKRAASIFFAFAILLCAASCGNGKRPQGNGAVEAAAGGAGSVTGKADSGGSVSNRHGSGAEGMPGIFPARDSYLTDSRWGYIDKTGSFVIQPVFSQAFSFQSNGLAVAGRGDRVGLIDRTGSFITEPVYTYINEYREGLAVAMDGSGSVVLDANGNVISEKYDHISDYSGGRAAYSVRAQDGSLFFGYLDETGKPVIEPVYMSVTAFEGGRAVVKLADGVHAIIDMNGKTVRTLDFWQVSGLSDGKAGFRQYPGGKYGYMDSSGNVIIKPAFTAAGDFIDGRAAAAVPGSGGTVIRGMIDEKGRFVVLPQYNEIIMLGEERAALGIPRDPNNSFAGSKYALADYNGRLLTDFEFFDIGRFNGGIAYAVDSTSTYFIDKSGKRVESLPSAEGAGRMEMRSGLVAADIDQRLYYMNEQGHVVYRSLSCIGTDAGVRVCEEKYKPNINYIVYYPVLGNMADLKIEPEVNRELREMWTDISTVSIKPDDVLDHHYEGGFSVVYSKKNLLVIMESGYDYAFGAAHGMPVMNHVHIDTRTGEFYELEDLFLDDSSYEDILSEIVRVQIEDMAGQDTDMYWIDSYEGIGSNHQFYITDKGLNLYFQPYEIAPYAAGFPTFMVTFQEIDDIIDKKGDFWRSFN
ncbi:MAG: DUF3298 domain-containing protein [Clostridiaceae bacterium]|nr:DUF3298 domain-containing protein [Clostridiaceae bacterium]